jgi:hypothetical protein
MNNLLIPGIIVGTVLLIGGSLMYNDNYKNILDHVDPELNHRVGDKYLGGGGKTIRKKHRNGKTRKNKP